MTGKAETRKQKAEMFSAAARPLLTFLLFAFCCLLFIPSLSACPVCFGDASSSLNKGASNGILFMLGIIGLVQIGFVALFVTFWRRAKALRAQREQFQLIDGGVQ